jgi:hypothetical protein
MPSASPAEPVEPAPSVAANPAEPTPSAAAATFGPRVEPELASNKTAADAVATPAPEATTPAAQPDATPPRGVAAERSPRPRPRPRPRPDAADTTRPAATPPEGVAQAGFGPTSASGASAPPHALFTPAAPGGAGGVPGPDGEAPGPEFTIKGNADSMLFHTPQSPYFERTRAEVWFRTADEAVAAGFTEWRPHRRTS